ncbi:MAG TPA: tetratricopeptide repeat protein, partial [Roseiflexaceae bacterium]|nr:tetratricopeptide repeat protein [Roseiflexaceae bacterium]
MARMSLQAAFEQAREWLEVNDLERAIGLCEHILQSYPNNLEAQRILGEACLANRQLDRAQTAFESVLRADPENIPAHVGLGITLERRGKIERAAQEFERALEIKPDMPELRSQLLRIYSDGGIENPQLRLSRAGLARLYAKGQMLPQAINEFRQVLKDQPDRSDAKVALAETLWRNEQEADAAALCRTLLAENPHLLKARLLLGYIEQAAGRPDGVEQWRAAAEMDPYQTVAQAMFEPLPAAPAADVSLEEWDEAAWRQRRVEEEVEQIDATRPMQAVPAAVEPEEEPQFMPGTGFFSRQPAPAAEEANTSDDFLASLLSFASPAPAAEAATTAEATATPPAAEIADNVETPAAETPAAEADDLELGDMQPFSFADLGLSDDEIAGLASLETLDSTPEAQPGAPQEVSEAGEPADDRSTQVFSADDFGDLGAGSTPAFTLDEPDASGETSAQPFSLGDDDDLGVEPFELDNLDFGDTQPDTGAEPVADLDTSDWADDLEAFSLDLGEAEQPEAKAAPQEGDEDDDFDLSSVAPFSLAELGLSDEEIASLGQAETADTPSTPAAERSPFRSDLLGELPPDLEPFSIDELDQASDEDASLPAALQPFSLDDTGSSQRPRVSGAMPEGMSDAGNDEDEESSTEQPGFSWQEPSQRSEPQFVSSLRRDEPPPEGSLFDKLKQLRQNEPPAEPEPLPQVSLEENEHLGLFSLDNESLRDERSSGQNPRIPNIAGIAQREGTALTPRTQPQPPTPANTPTPPAPPERREQPIDEEGSITADALEPFTLAELGLNDEEIAALGLGENATAASDASGTPGDQDEELEPFSLAGFDLEDDLPALDLGDTAGEASPEAAS